MKSLEESLSKSRGYLEPKRTSMIELFCEYSQRITIFAKKAPS